MNFLIERIKFLSIVLDGITEVEFLATQARSEAILKLPYPDVWMYVSSDFLGRTMYGAFLQTSSTILLRAFNARGLMDTG